MTRPRWLLLGVAVVVLVGLAAADRVARPDAARDDAIIVASAMPTAAPEDAIASTWFCAGGSAQAGSDADATVVIANPTRTEIVASVLAMPLEGDPVSVPVAVPPLARRTVRLGDLVTAPYVGATVDLKGGGAVVEQLVTGRGGTSATPCAATGSDRWYFADGSTAREDTMLLALYNPFPEDSIVDLAFSTEQGRAVPSDFQGIVVRGGRLAVVNVGDHVRRRERVATTVRARTGRVVAFRQQLRGATPRGTSVSLGAPSLGEEWWFVEGFVTAGVAERFSVSNPGDREAVVSVELVIDGEPIEPFDLTVPPRDRVDVIASDEERVPKDQPHSTVVRSLNGVPVVAERSLAAGAPSGRNGRSETLGARRAATRWVFAAGSATEAADQWMSVLNPGTTPAHVSFTALAEGQPLAIDGLQDVEVPGGRRIAFRIGDHVQREDLPLLVESLGGPVVVERALYGVGAASPGVSLAFGVPLR